VFVFQSGGVGQVFAPDGSYARTIRAPGRTVFAVAPDGSGDIYTTGRFRWDQTDAVPRVVRLSADGSPRDSFPIFVATFGTTWVRQKASDAWVASRTPSEAVMAPDGSVWTTVHETYRLERHAPAGATKQLIGVEVPGRDRPRLTAAAIDSVAPKEPGPPGPFARDVMWVQGGNTVRLRTGMLVDTAGLLWVFRSIMAPKFDTITVTVDYLAPDEAPEERTIPRDIEERLTHTIVEVIDPQRAELIARATLPFQAFPTAPGYAGRVSADDRGQYVTSVYPLRLVRDRR
jgi:hypothetical protein